MIILIGGASHAGKTLLAQRLLETYRDGKLGQVNYIVKNAILNAFAFGPAFFNQQQG